MMHSPPFTMYEELLHAFDAKGLIALAGDGRAALACVERRLLFCGLTLSEPHTLALMAYLESRVFERVANCKSKLHVPALAALLDRKTEEQGAGNTEAPKAKKPRGRGRGRGRGEGRKNKTIEQAGEGEGEGAEETGPDDGEAGGGEASGSVDLLAHVKKLAAAASAS